MIDLKKWHRKLPLTIEAKKDYLLLIDQTLLPKKLKFKKLNSYLQVVEAIKNMRVRGAQALGAAGAGGIFLASLKYRGIDVKEFKKFLNEVSRKIISSRPTAVNLSWSVKKIIQPFAGETVEEMKKEISRRFRDLLRSEVENNLKLGEYGDDLIKDGSRIQTHCNAGSLSSIWFGTATAPIFTAHLKGKKIKVLVDETRPWLQGSRLTAWEMEHTGIDYQINIDAASGYMMSKNMVDMVIVGADRIAANGDAANKIGTYLLAMMAYHHKVPFYVAAVTSTIDFSIASGKEIVIEERSGFEIVKAISYKGGPVAPAHAKTFNPVFDVTPAEYITGFITEKGIIKPQDLKKLK